MFKQEPELNDNIRFTKLCTDILKKIFTKPFTILLKRGSEWKFYANTDKNMLISLLRETILIKDLFR